MRGNAQANIAGSLSTPNSALKDFSEKLTAASLAHSKRNLIVGNGRNSLSSAQWAIARTVVEEQSAELYCVMSEACSTLKQPQVSNTTVNDAADLSEYMRSQAAVYNNFAAVWAQMARDWSMRSGDDTFIHSLTSTCTVTLNLLCDGPFDFELPLRVWAPGAGQAARELSQIGPLTLPQEHFGCLWNLSQDCSCCYRRPFYALSSIVQKCSRRSCLN